MRIGIRKESGRWIDALLLPYRDKSGWLLVDLTQGYVCPEVFRTSEEALEAIRKHSEVASLEYWKI